MSAAIVRYCAVTVALLAFLAARPSFADFHLWRFSEVFSSLDGKIQFIELSSLDDAQHRLDGHRFTTQAASKELLLPSDLPSAATAQKTFLLGTPGFVALQTSPNVDYLIPDNFFSPQGDTITFIDADTITFTVGQLPLDGVRSLLPNGSTANNSPQNFSGQTGKINVPAEHPWRNVIEPLDVDNDGVVVPLDALIVINHLDDNGSHDLPVPPDEAGAFPYLDANGDDSVAPIDALVIINQLDTSPLAALAAPAMLAPAFLAPVPEPSALALALVALSCWLVRSRLARRR